MSQLFEKFEINRTPRWPMLSRLVALSVVAHGLFFVAVVYVPTLRGLLYVASNVSGIKFVSEDYDPTLVGQRATVVKLEPHEPLYYPPDYFGAPEVAETTALDAMVIEPPPPLPPPAPAYRPRRSRAPRAVEETPEPSPTPEEVAQATPSPTPEPLTEEQKKAEAEMERIAKENGIARPPGNINTKPFEDIAVKGKELFDQGKLNLNSAIDVTATAALNEDGTLKADTVNFDWKTASDQNTADLALQLVNALSQSRVLRILKGPDSKGAENVTVSLRLDQQTVRIAVLSDMPTAQEAMKTAIGCQALVTIGKQAKKGSKEGVLYENLKFDSSGRQFMMNFEMPKEEAGKMITEMLAKKAGKPNAAAAATPQARS
jgi:hypothetical protein